MVSSLALPSLGIVLILSLVPCKMMMSASKYVRKRSNLLYNSLTCVCSIGSLLLVFAGICQDLWMCNFVCSWKMTGGLKKRASARSSVTVFCFHVVVPVMKYCLILLLAEHFPRLCQYPSGSSAAIVPHSGRRANSGAALPLATAEATLPSSTSLSTIGEASESSMRAVTDLRP